MICPHGEWSPHAVLMELLHTKDDSQCLTFDLGVVSLCGTQCS